MPALNHCIEEDIPAGLRLDRYVAEYLRILSRSQIKARKLEGTVNGKKAKLSSPVKKGDILALSWNEAEVPELVPEDIALDILYEAEQVVVINKPQGMVVHPGAGNYRGTLANALYFRQLNRGSFLPEGLRPGIVHRLDKDTSGVIIAAYNDVAHTFLSDQFKSRTVKKTYIALVSGRVKNAQGRIETFIARDPRNRKLFAVREGGKTAITLYRLIKTWDNYSLLLLRPRTGRTHQLRVHMKHLGHPICGDSLYGSPDALFPRLMLHAKSLEITLPGNEERHKFSSPLPERFRELIRKLNGKNAEG